MQQVNQNNDDDDLISFQNRTSLNQQQEQEEYEEKGANICFICKIPIDLNIDDMTRFGSCGHMFHSNCIHFFICNQFNHCIECHSKTNKMMMMNDTYDIISNGDFRELIINDDKSPKLIFQSNPIDWGDNTNTRKLLVDRLCLFKQIKSSTDITKSTQTLPFGQQETGGEEEEINKMRNEFGNISISNVVEFLNQRETNRQKPISSTNTTSIENTIIQPTTSTLEKQSSFSKFSNFIKTTIPNTNDYTDSLIRNNPFEALNFKKEMATIIMTFKINVFYLISKQINVDFLFSRSYSIQDLFLIPGINWKILVNDLGFTCDVWFKYKKHININQLVKCFQVKFTDIFVDVCKKNFNALVKIGLTADDFQLLKVTSQILCNCGMTKEIMPFMNIQMEDWNKKLILTDELMVNHLQIQPNFLIIKQQLYGSQPQMIVRNLGWLSIDDEITRNKKLDQFCKLFPKYHTLVKLDKKEDIFKE